MSSATTFGKGEAEHGEGRQAERCPGWRPSTALLEQLVDLVVGVGERRTGGLEAQERLHGRVMIAVMSAAWSVIGNRNVSLFLTWSVNGVMSTPLALNAASALSVESGWPGRRRLAGRRCPGRPATR